MLGLVFKATYVGTKGNFLLRTRDLNLIANPSAPATSVADETGAPGGFYSSLQRSEWNRYSPQQSY
ncbi:MAG: hypothetical protein WDO18_03185 [Acidobacteriota bacterium]